MNTVRNDFIIKQEVEQDSDISGWTVVCWNCPVVSGPCRAQCEMSCVLYSYRVN